jgi:hypothetical protein
MAITDTRQQELVRLAQRVMPPTSQAIGDAICAETTTNEERAFALSELLLSMVSGYLALIPDTAERHTYAATFIGTALVMADQRNRPTTH